jgi:predicted aspartyl protease
LGLSRNDVVGVASVTDVNGRSTEPVVLLREVNIGGVALHNAKATVGRLTLLGQSFLAKLGTYTVDNRRGVLVLTG